ncbi:hypothetical protein Pelo_17268 [Pelomyxa schiedti]|nr:hypothetical protein Pelo_17268 [Pelomyxa schiedti]
MCAATVVEETRAERVVGAAGRVSELVVGGWARPRVFWVLGPNFDSSFWYRTTGNENRLDVGNYKSYGRLEAEATAPCPAIGKPVIPRFEDMHEVERSLVCMASYISRAKVMADLVKTTIPVAVPVTRSLTSDNDPVDGRLKGLITSVNTNMHMFRLTCGALVIKHFPAAPGPIQETGELQLAKLDIPLHQLLHWQLPFTDNFHCSLPASSS